MKITKQGVELVHVNYFTVPVFYALLFKQFDCKIICDTANAK